MATRGRRVLLMRSGVLFGLLLSAMAPPSAYAAVARVGSEFQVNTYTTQNQLMPDVAVAPGGSFVVVWTSDSQDGSVYGIFGQRYDSAGDPMGAEFQVNTYATSYQYVPAVAMDGTGAFVVVWSSVGQDGDTHGIFGQRFDSVGATVGMEFQVNTYTTQPQSLPDVAAGRDGDFVVVWNSFSQDGSYGGVFAQRYDSEGMPNGLEFQVNSHTTGNQVFPAIAIDGSGGFVAVWEGHGQDGDGGGIFGQRYDSSGAKAGDEFQVNTYTTYGQAGPAVAAREEGEFLVVWKNPGPAIDTITGRRYDSGGQPLGGEFQVSASTSYYQGEGGVAANENGGGFVVAWSEIPGAGGSADIIGRRLDASGSPVDPEFQVNTYTSFKQFRPAAATNAAGDLVIVWQGHSEDDSGYGISGYGISGQRFHGRAPGLVSHVSGDVLDCSDPAVTRPTFTWDPGGYDRFRVYLSSDPVFAKGTYVTSGDTLRPGTSWEPSVKKWRKACMKAIAADPMNPEMFIRILGKDADLGKQDRARLRFSETMAGDVQP